MARQRVVTPETLPTLVQGKAPLVSPAFTGSPTAPTPSGDTGIANKNYVDAAIGALSPTYFLAPNDPDPVAGSPAGVYIRWVE